MPTVRHRLASRLPSREKYLLIGLATRLPGWRRRHHSGTATPASARYAYSVWLRHLVHASRGGLAFPRAVAELGPGTSLGVGLAALVCGAERYYALDLARDTDPAAELPIFDELCDLVRSRAPIPDENEFPEILPPLDECAFPHEVLTEDRLRDALRPERLQSLRAQLLDEGLREGPDAAIRYAAPWFESPVVEAEMVDFLISQAVLEHVDDLPGTFAVLIAALRPGGIMSHQIDYRSHGVAADWNGHWAYSELTWRIMRGRHLNLINRSTHSQQTEQMQATGLSIVTDLRFRCASALPRERLARRFREISDADLCTYSGFIQAQRPAR